MVPVGVPLGDPACIQWTCAWKLSRKREWVQTHPIFGPRFGRPTRLSGSRGSATAASYVSLTPVALGANYNQQLVHPWIQQFYGLKPNQTSDSGSGAGCLVAGSSESSEAASSLGLLLPASCFSSRRKGEISFPTGRMARLRTGTTKHPLAFPCGHKPSQLPKNGLGII